MYFYSNFNPIFELRANFKSGTVRVRLSSSSHVMVEDAEPSLTGFTPVWNACRQHTADSCWFRGKWCTSCGCKRGGMLQCWLPVIKSSYLILGIHRVQLKCHNNKKKPHPLFRDPDGKPDEEEVWCVVLHIAQVCCNDAALLGDCRPHSPSIYQTCAATALFWLVWYSSGALSLCCSW